MQDHQIYNMARVVTISDVYYLLRNGRLTLLRRKHNGPSALTSTTAVIEAYATKDGFLDSEVAIRLPKLSVGLYFGFLDHPRTLA